MYVFIGECMSATVHASALFEADFTLFIAG